MPRVTLVAGLRFVLLLAALAVGAWIVLSPRPHDPTGASPIQATTTSDGPGADPTRLAPMADEPPPVPAGSSALPPPIRFWRIGVALPSVAPHLPVPIHLRIDPGHARFEGRAFGANFTLARVPGTGPETMLRSAPSDPGKGVPIAMDASILEALEESHRMMLSVDGETAQPVVAHRIPEAEWTRVRYRGAVQGLPKPASPEDADENALAARHLAAELWIDLPVPSIADLTESECVWVCHLVAEALQRGLPKGSPAPRVARTERKLRIHTAMGLPQVAAYLRPILSAPIEPQIAVEPLIAVEAQDDGSDQVPLPGSRPRTKEFPGWVSPEAWDHLPVSGIGRSYLPGASSGATWDDEALASRWSIAFPSICSEAKRCIEQRVNLEFDLRRLKGDSLTTYEVESNPFNVRNLDRLTQEAHVLVLKLARQPPVGRPTGVQVSVEVYRLRKARSAEMEAATMAHDPGAVVPPRGGGPGRLDSFTLLNLALAALKK